MPAATFLGYYAQRQKVVIRSASRAYATGKTLTVTITTPGGTVDVSAAAMTDEGDGFYSFSYSPSKLGRYKALVEEASGTGLKTPFEFEVASSETGIIKISRGGGQLTKNIFTGKDRREIIDAIRKIEIIVERIERVEKVSQTNKEELKEDISSITSANSELKQTIDTLQSKIDSTEDKIDNLPDSIDVTPEVKKVIEEVKDIRKEIQDLNTEIEKNTVIIEKLAPSNVLREVLDEEEGKN